MIAEPSTSRAVTGRDLVPAQDRRQVPTPAHAGRGDVHAVVVRQQTPSHVADALSALLGTRR
jgi:hypothetical protein